MKVLTFADGYLDDWAARRKEERNLSLIMQQFLAQLGAAFGGLPDTYMAADVETSGFAHEDVILQLGYCLVEDGKAVERVAITLDWTKRIEEAWLRDRLEQTRLHVEYEKSGFASGRRYHFNLDVLRGGTDPVDSLREFYGLLTDCRPANVPLVFHGGYNLDQRMLRRHFKEFLNEDWEFGDNEVWDTGAIERACQLGILPNPNESIKDFSRRAVAGSARGVFWSLDRFCVPRYQLDKKYGFDIGQAHDAGFDAWVTHLLFEEYKAIARKEIPDPDETPW